MVESLVTIMIFAIMSVLLAGVFSGFLKNFYAVKKSQKSSENAQYAINLMAKTIRNSSIDEAVFINGKQITMFDNSRSVCVSYKYAVDSRLKIAVANAVNSIADCGPGAAWTAFVDLANAGEIANVSFYSAAPALSTDRRKVTVAVNVDGDSAAAVQTSISLRQ